MADTLDTSSVRSLSNRQDRAPKPKPWRMASVIDGRQLRVQLSAAALEHIGEDKALRARALELLHGALFRGRMIAQERLRDGADGLDIARLLAAVQDEVLQALYDFTVAHVFRARNPTQAERMALFAVGGYGRGVLAPSSDIDLLFVRNYKQTAWAESVIEYMLYMLWDMGLKVGHAFRTVDECIRLCREDLNTQTALLDARFLLGDAELGTDLLTRFSKDVMEGREDKFIAGKLAERNARHDRQGSTRYVVEPNVKEGKGGLRDLQTLFWLVKASYGGTTIEDILRNRNVFTPREARTFKKAARFLWTVRCQLHYLTGRHEERLTFDVQPEIAQRLSFEDRDGRLGVERFMKRYFLVAKDVGVLTRILCARLEAENRKELPEIFRILTGKRDDPFDSPDFIMRNARLSIRDEHLFETSPIAMLKLFELADTHELDIHPVAFSAVMRSLHHFSPEARKSEEACKLFLHLLMDSRSPGRILRMMNESGLLGRMVPEFGGIVAQTQFNMYHSYTVDEHTLRAVETLSEIERAEGETIHPLAKRLMGEIEGRRALYLAMLLHDTGKGHGDQQIEGAKTAARASERLGLDPEEVRLISWLVGNHLEMSDTAQKRDISDPRTIASFANTVGTVERLRLLLILTVADIRAVGPGIWNGWKGQLLRDLYEATAPVLKETSEREAHAAHEIEARAARARAELAASRARIPPLMLEMDAAYWSTYDMNDLTWQADALERSTQRPVIDLQINQETSSVELMVAHNDRLDLFADIVAAITTQGASIAAAQIFTGESGGVIDVFVLQDEEGGLFAAGETSRLDRLKKTVRDSILGDAPEPKRKPGPEKRREAVFLIDP